MSASRAAHLRARIRAAVATQVRTSVVAPSCVPCSLEWAEMAGVPGLVPVESSLVVRDAERGYLVLARCHGKSAIVSLGESPTEATLANLRIGF